MHHRNERNAIIQHGTMTMVRTLVDTGSWSEWTICEDAEPPAPHARGLHLVYVDELMQGPDSADFTAYSRNATAGRRRDADHEGALRLDGAQDSLGRAAARSPISHRLVSWFADALHLVFTMMAIA